MEETWQRQPRMPCYLAYVVNVLKNEINIHKRRAILNMRRAVAKKGISSCFVPIPNMIIHNFLLSTKMYHLDSHLDFVHGVVHCHVCQTADVLLRCQTWQRVAVMPDMAHGVAALPRLPRH